MVVVFLLMMHGSRDTVEVVGQVGVVRSGVAGLHYLVGL